MDKLEALLKVIVDGQAVLYSLVMKAIAVAGQNYASDEQVLAWQDEWKQQTANLVEELTDEQTSKG